MDGNDSPHPAARTLELSELTSLDNEALTEELCSQAARLAAGTCRFVVLLAAFDDRRAWAHEGIKSCAHWLNWRLGFALSGAREQLRVGRAVAQLPQILAAFAGGRLSYSKVRALTRVAEPHNEEALLGLAEAATASQLETICRAYRTARDRDNEAAEAHRRRSVRHWSTDQGTVVIRAELPTDDAAIVLAALEGAMETLAGEDGETGDAASEEEERDASRASAEASTATGAQVPTDPSDTDPSERLVRGRADALVAMAESVVARGLDPASGPERIQVHLHLDERLVADPAAQGCCRLEGLGTIGLATAQRLACDAAIQRYRVSADGILELAGSTQAIPRRLRRALVLRDGGCRWPGCTQRRYVDAHHVVFWSKGGPTVLSNLVLLCRSHHRMVHEGDYVLELTDDAQVRLRSPEGMPIATVPPRLSHAGDGVRGNLGPAPATVPFGGERYHLGCTIDALLCIDQRAVGTAQWGASPDETPRDRLSHDPGSHS